MASGAEDGRAPAAAAANTLLWPVRGAVDLLFLATGTVGNLIENERIVPRAKDVFFTRGGEFGLFPTLFLETGTNPNVGARMLARSGPFATTFRCGYGGPDSAVAESRLLLNLPTPVPAVFALEGLHDRRNGLAFRGVGQTPEADPRNGFLGDARVGFFRERRARLIGSLGFRPLSDLQFVLSSSLTVRLEDEAQDGPSLAQVFSAPAIAGAERPARLTYTELAARYDSRPSPRALSTGVLVEGYAGLAQGISWDKSSFARTGVRLGVFMPFVRRANVLSAQLVLEGATPLQGHPVPFRELTGQPSFRGVDSRRDLGSAVVSLDYRWYVLDFLAGRLFFDMARVFPSLGELSFDELRTAVGFGFDLQTSATDIGRVAVGFGNDGVRFLLTLGVVGGFGDRQHRD